MDAETFNDFIERDNVVGRLLIAHFLAIQIVFNPIIDREWAGRQRSTPVRTSLEWIRSVSDLLPPDKKSLAEWPRAIADSVVEELSGKQSIVPKISILRRREGHNVAVF